MLKKDKKVKKNNTKEQNQLLKKQKAEQKKLKKEQAKAAKRAKKEQKKFADAKKYTNKGKHDPEQKKNLIHTTIAESIPYEKVYKNGLFELKPNLYSRTYRIQDVNYKNADDSMQWALSELYANMLGSFDSDIQIELTLYNRSTDILDFQNSVMLGMKADGLNEYRVEYNNMLLEKMTGGKNNLETEIYMTLTFFADDIMDACERVTQLDKIMTDNITTLTKKDAEPLSVVERLDLLNTIYNQDAAGSIYQTKIIDGKKVESFSLENCIKQGITTKDVIKPPSMAFRKSEIELGNYVAKSYYISNYPTWIKGTLLRDLASVSTNMLVSTYFNSMPVEDSTAMLKRQGVNISSLVLESQKRAARGGYDASLISPELQSAKTEAEELMTGLNKDNMRLFLANIVITLFASDKEKLDNYEAQLKSIANKNLLTVLPLNSCQENGFNTSLPIGHNQLDIQRLITSETVLSLSPFHAKDIKQKGGMYYGLNATSGNMILYDRTTDLNPNGCILGMPGAGKSFSAKREMINVLLNTDDDVYIIDPECEYKAIVEALNGTIIKIAPGSGIHINPFDLNMENKDDDDDPIKVKANFISTICEIAVGGRFGLGPAEKSIIDRCAEKIYEPYLKALQESGKTYDPEIAPTMEDFYKMLRMQPDAEARNLCLSLERYVYGSTNLFSHRTNVNINNRFVVYDIKDIGSGLKELGLQICLDNIWNKMIENKEKGKRTWIYIDEFYLMMQKKTSAEYIAQIWKRARKWDGVPTAITQNVEDLLKSPEARTIINNCSFVMLLGQAPMNKQQLSELLSISPSEQKYISSAKPGMGLLHIGSDNIPMDDNFPKETKLYKIMSTKPNEKI